MQKMFVDTDVAGHTAKETMSSQKKQLTLTLVVEEYASCAAGCMIKIVSASIGRDHTPQTQMTQFSLLKGEAMKLINLEARVDYLTKTYGQPLKVMRSGMFDESSIAIEWRLSGGTLILGLGHKINKDCRAEVYVPLKSGYKVDDCVVDRVVNLIALMEEIWAK